ncbi:MAG: zinc ribbon domain-containing protein [Thaumarchaeota archaeon]|nr:zinc ribbon domain-containing protein [Nitrososphaerota archaeon]
MFGKKKEKNEPHKPDNIEIQKQDSFELEDIFLIPVSEVPEKSKYDVAISIEKSREFLKNNNIFEEAAKWPIVLENGERYLADIYLPMKCKGESVLWYRKIQEGLINKTINEYEVLSEYRCYRYLLKSHRIGCLPISPDLDVIVTNQMRISQSQREGTFAGLGSRGTFVGSVGGISIGESQTVGDVNVMQEGEIAFTFFSVQDPNGLAKLIKYVIKKTKEIWEEDSKRIQAKRELQNQTTDLHCEKCGTTNIISAKFCNKCGNKLKSKSGICAKCGKENPSGSSFCNSCGFALQ